MEGSFGPGTYPIAYGISRSVSGAAPTCWPWPDTTAVGPCPADAPGQETVTSTRTRNSPADCSAPTLAAGCMPCGHDGAMAEPPPIPAATGPPFVEFAFG